MRFEELLELVGDEPVFASSLLSVVGVSPQQAKLQLVRWVNDRKLIRLRRSLYALNLPFRKVEAHPFLLANRIRKASYVSLQSALSYYNLIPEHVPVVTSVTTGRPEEVRTELGIYVFRHVQKPVFGGFLSVKMAPGQSAFLATPEKALLDLIYFSPGGDQEAFIDELRLQNETALSAQALTSAARLFESPKINRAVASILALISSERERTP
jgi:predicted transcriptional regulator of viral defense system